MMTPFGAAVLSLAMLALFTIWAALVILIGIKWFFGWPRDPSDKWRDYE